MLEPDEGKLSSPVLRGEGGSNTADLLDRPSDIEQREGRIIRQGNCNKSVKIFRYVTEGTFDSYSWQLIENKQKFISQIMTSKSPVRSCEDVDEASLTYAEVKALATGNPYIKEKMDLDIQVSRLKLLKANHSSQIYRLEDNIVKHYPLKIRAVKERMTALQNDIQLYEEKKPKDKEAFAIEIKNRILTDKKEAGRELIAFCGKVKTQNSALLFGKYLGFAISIIYNSFSNKFVLNVKGSLTHEIELGTDSFGNLTRLNHALEALPEKLVQTKETLRNVEKQLENAKIEVTKPFQQEIELEKKLKRLAELNATLNMDEKEVIADSIDQEEEQEKKVMIEQVERNREKKIHRR